LKVDRAQNGFFRHRSARFAGSDQKVYIIYLIRR
jgi:hypothetical protein